MAYCNKNSIFLICIFHILILPYYIHSRFITTICETNNLVSYLILIVVMRLQLFSFSPSKYWDIILGKNKFLQCYESHSPFSAILVFIEDRLKLIFDVTSHLSFLFIEPTRFTICHILWKVSYIFQDKRKQSIYLT